MARYGRATDTRRWIAVRAHHIGAAFTFVLAFVLVGQASHFGENPELASDAYLASSVEAAADQEFFQDPAKQHQVVADYLASREANAATRATRDRSIEEAQAALDALNAQAANTTLDRDGVLNTAASLAGIPYHRGGTTTNGFDCSGYTQYVYRQLGISIPRVSSSQSKWADPVSREEAKPGDLIFFHSGSGHVYHVAIYAGGNQMWHAPYPGRSVQKVAIYSGHVTFGKIPAKAVNAQLNDQIDQAEVALQAAEEMPVTPVEIPAVTP